MLPDQNSSERHGENAQPSRQYVVPFHDESGSAVESHSSVFIRGLRRRSTRLSGEKIHLHVTTTTEITENDFCVENVINGSSATIVKTTTPFKKYILLLDTVFHGESSHFYFFFKSGYVKVLSRGWPLQNVVHLPCKGHFPWVSNCQRYDTNGGRKDEEKKKREGVKQTKKRSRRRI